MRRRPLFLLSLFAIFAMLALAAVSQDQAAPSAESWLALMDSGKYGESWSEASTMFRTHVTAQQWTDMASAARTPLGTKTSRKLKTIKFTTALPGAPDGNYAVIQYDSSFSHKATAVETLTLMEDAGKWRTAGYFIK